MILLIGPNTWMERLKRELESHTTHRGRVVTRPDQLRGVHRTWIEVIVYTDMRIDWEPESWQLEAMDMADHLNTLFVRAMSKT